MSITTTANGGGHFSAVLGRSCFAAGISNLQFSKALTLNNISYCVTAIYPVSHLCCSPAVWSAAFIPWLKSHLKEKKNGLRCPLLVAFALNAVEKPSRLYSS